MEIQISENDFYYIYNLFHTNLKIFLISVTHKCNLNCGHCIVAARKQVRHIMDTKYIKTAINQFSSLPHAREVVLGGGEPFTRRDIVELIEFSVKKGMFVVVETNGTLLKKETINKLKKIRKKILFKISIDALTPEKHDKFRGLIGTFKQALKNIVYLRKANIPVMINTVLTKWNKDEVAKIMDYFVEKLGCGHTLIARIAPLGRGKRKSSQNLNLSPEELLNFLHEVYYPKFRTLVRKGYGNLYIEIPKPFIPNDIKLFPKCDWGTKIIGLTAKGKVGICHYAPDNSIFTAGYLNKRKSLLDLWWHADTFKKLRTFSPKKLKGICGNCKYAEICRGFCRIYAFQIYKDFYAPNPMCQQFYEKGLFPSESLISATKKCHYPDLGLL